MNGQSAKRGLLIALCAFGFLLFSGLGIWQIERRAWKLDLIQRVEQRVHAAPVALPPRADWAGLKPADVEYRRVRVTGRFDHRRSTLVDALTERGPGYWLMTPFLTDDGPVLVNRGFVPKGVSLPEPPIGPPVAITGLLRLSEPDGRFLRPNRSSANLWYSRDVPAIAAARGLKGAAPFFIDAEATAGAKGYPIGGLTVVTFRNTHLIYALTWFGLAGLCVAGLVLLLKASHKRG